jgi:molybdate transport system regulatory protein
MKPKRDKPRRDHAVRAPKFQPRLRGRLWVETGGAVALTDAGADLLEQIDVAGSLSEAARRLRFSYRRAWMLVDGMNRRWPGPLVALATGGKRGGGAHLTELGRHVLAAFRDLQLRFEHFLDTSSPQFFRSLRC